MPLSASRLAPVELRFISAFNEMRAHLFEIHKSKGWTASSKPDDIAWRGNQLMMMVGEIAEAHEAMRKDLHDDKVVGRLGLEVELADAIIRMMNFATETNLDLSGALVEKSRFNETRPHMHGNKLC